jgi:hypothetical protein
MAKEYMEVGIIDEPNDRILQILNIKRPLQTASAGNSFEVWSMSHGDCK